MPNTHVWYELITTDQEAAEAFYAEVMGWKLIDSGLPGMRYTIIQVGERPIGGIMAMESGPLPIWMGYVGVDDVDAYAVRVKDAGGSVQKPADDIPGVGRFAVVADPQGAPFVIFRGNGTPDPEPLPYMTPGTVGWHELHSSAWESAFKFYAGLFGWEKGEALDMGPVGTYQLIRTGAFDHADGAMFNNGGMPRSMWAYYVSVPSIAVAQQKIEAKGGKVVNGPMEVPGGMWVINAIDPQGAMFSAVGPKE